MSPEHQEPAFAFDVFISYSRRDILFARALETSLENYIPPNDLPVPHRHLKVFRDEEDFTGVEYNQALREHLESSEKMLVICSPHARASTYVCQEIRLFAEKRGAQHIIPVLLSGIPNNEAKTPEHEEKKAFPQCLRRILGDMPLAASFLELDPARDKLYKGVFKGPWYTVLANVYGVSRSDIEQRERTRITRRRWIRTSLAVGVILALSCALMVTFFQYKNSVSSRNLAFKALTDAENLIEFMVFDLRDALEPIGRLDLLSSINRRVKSYCDSLGNESLSTELSADIQRQKSVAIENIGNVMFAQGKVDDALDNHLASRNIRKDLTAQDPTNTLWQRDLSISHNKVGDVLMAKDRPDEALEAFVAGREITERLTVLDPTNTLWQHDLSISYERIGDVHVAKNQFDDALDAYVVCIDFRQKLTTRDATNSGWQRDLSISHNKVGDVLMAKDRPDEALEAFVAGREIAERLTVLDPTNTLWQRDLSISYERIGNVLLAKDRLDEALEAFVAGREIAERLTVLDPTNTLWQRDLSVSHNKVGDVLMAKDRPDEALEAFVAGRKITERLTVLDPTNTLWQHDLSISYERIGDVHVAKNQFDDALDAYVVCIDFRQKLTTRDATNSGWQRDLSVSHNKVGDVLMAKDRPDEALEAFVAGREIAERLTVLDPTNTLWQRDLSISYERIGNVLLAKDRLDDALAANSAAITIRKKLCTKGSEQNERQREFAFALIKNAEIMIKQENIIGATSIVREAVDIYAQCAIALATSDLKSEIATAWGYLSFCLLFSQQPEDAIEAAEKGIETDPSQIWIYTNLAHGYLFCGRYPEAEKLYLEHCDDILDEGRRFDQAVVDDFKELRRNGVEHPDMERIESLLASRR